MLPVLWDLGGFLGPVVTRDLLASKDHKQNLGCEEVQDLTAHQDLSVNLDLLE